MTLIHARPPYTPPGAPKQYDAVWERTQLASLAKADKPTTGRTVTTATIVAATDEVIYCDATAGPFTVTLLPANQVQFLTVSIIKIDASANAVTLGGTVSGAVNPTLATQYKAKTINSNGIAWYALSAI